MTARINEDVINQVNESTDMVDLVADYLELKPSGSNYLGLCPFHNEKTPSFTVSRSKEFYHCFGCGAGGDGIDFVMKMENLSFVEAVKFLADRNGIELGETTEEDRQRLEEQERIYSMNREAARFYYNNLLKSSYALKYLQNRGLEMKVINNFGLGFAENSWDSLLRHLQSRGYKENEIFEAGLSGQRRDKSGYYDRFRNRIIFPIINSRGKVIGFGGRMLGDDMPKYLNSQDTKVFTKGNNLYGLNIINKNKDRDRILLVEGYMDVISLYNHGIRYSVASLGTALTENQAKLLKRYGKDVYICYDGDIAGQKATLKALEILKSLDVDARVIALPDGMDPDDYIKEEGIEGFSYLLNRKNMNYLDYHIYVNKKKYNLNDPDEKIDFTRDISKMIKALNSPIEKEVYIDKISIDTGISREAILEEVNRIKPNIVRENYERFKSSKLVKTSKKEKVKLDPAYIQAEKTLIKLSMSDINFFNLINERLENGFISRDYNTLFELIRVGYSKSKEIDKNCIGEMMAGTDIENSNIIEEVEKVDLKLLTKKEEDTIKLIELLNKTRLEIERDSILKDIRVAQDEQDMELLAKLTLKLIELNEKLKN